MSNIDKYQEWGSIIFFIFCGIGLFFGDGKQPFIDLLAIMLVIILYGYGYIVGFEYKTVPKKILLPWLCVLGYSIFRTLFSDSIGLSISQTTRLITTFLIFNFFYSSAHERSLKRFTTGLMSFSILAILFSFVCILFPNYAASLPSMNLLYASYGHNQLAGLLFFSFPLVIHQFLQKSTFKNTVFFLLFFVAFFLSFARGAFILFSLYLLYLCIQYLKRKQILQSIFLTSLLIFFVLILATLAVFAHYHETPLPISYWLRKQITKPFDLSDTRLQYWQQAVAAFKDAPFFGHGPGTFWLLSKRYQDKPNQYSYFAHSFPLETLAEGGIVGFILMALLLGYVAPRLVIARSASDAAISYEHSAHLLEGLTLTFLYSFVEFNFNFIVIFLIFWAALAVLLSKTSPTHQKQFNIKKILVILLGVCVTYYVLSITSLLLSSTKSAKLQTLPLYLAPFDRFQVIKYLSSNKLLTDPSLLETFHKQDAEVMFQISQKIRSSQTDKADMYLLTAINAEPQNFTYFKKYIDQQVLKSTDIKELAIILEEIEKKTFFRMNDQKLVPPNFNNLLDIKTMGFLKNEREYPLYFSKLYYFIGLKSLYSDPQTTKVYWALASKINPDMGLLYHERASLELYVFRSKLDAQKVVSECNRIHQAQLHCKQIWANLENLTVPGELSHEISVLD